MLDLRLRPILRGLLPVAALALVLVACGDDGGDPPDPDAVGEVDGTDAPSPDTEDVTEPDADVPIAPDAPDVTEPGDGPLLVTPDTLDFGSVVIGARRELSFVVKNVGESAIALGQLEVEGEGVQVLLGPPASLEPGAAREVVLRYSPQAPGTLAGAALLASDDGDSAVPVSLVGAALEASGDPAITPAMTGRIELGALALGDSLLVTVPLSNPSQMGDAVEAVDFAFYGWDPASEDPDYDPTVGGSFPSDGPLRLVSALPADVPAGSERALHLRASFALPGVDPRASSALPVSWDEVLDERVLGPDRLVLMHGSITIRTAFGNVFTIPWSGSFRAPDPYPAPLHPSALTLVTPSGDPLPGADGGLIDPSVAEAVGFRVTAGANWVPGDGVVLSVRDQFGGLVQRVGSVDLSGEALLVGDISGLAPGPLEVRTFTERPHGLLRPIRSGFRTDRFLLQPLELEPPVVTSPLPELTQLLSLTLVGAAQPGVELVVHGAASPVRQQLDATGAFEVDVPLRVNAMNELSVCARVGDQQACLALRPFAQITPSALADATVTSRLLDREEVDVLIAAGLLDLDDPDNFHISEIEICLRVNSGRCLRIPTLRPRQGAPGTSCDLLDPESNCCENIHHCLQGSPGRSGSSIRGQTVDGQPGPGGAAIFIGSRIGTLRELFEVTVILANASPQWPLEELHVALEVDEGLSIMNESYGADGVSVSWEPGRHVALEPLAPAPAGSASVGAAQFFVRGDATGRHALRVSYGGFVRGVGLPEGGVRFDASAEEHLDVVGPPELDVTVFHPSSLTAGEPYAMRVEVVNRAPIPALYAWAQLRVGGVAHLAEIASECGDLETCCSPEFVRGVERQLGHLAPGAGASFTVDVVACISGPVVDCAHQSSGNINLRVVTGTLCHEGEELLEPSSRDLPRAPTLVLTAPEHQGVIPHGTEVLEAYFDGPLANATEETVLVHELLANGQLGARLPGTVEVETLSNGSTAVRFRVDPLVQPFIAGRRYRLTLRGGEGGVRGGPSTAGFTRSEHGEGEPLPHDVDVDFAVGPDLSAPFVVEVTSPLSGEVLTVSPSAAFVTMSAAVDSGSVRVGGLSPTFAVLSGDLELGEVWRVNDTTLGVALLGTLEAGEGASLQVGGLASAGGVAMDVPHGFGFVMAQVVEALTWPEEVDFWRGDRDVARRHGQRWVDGVTWLPSAKDDMTLSSRAAVKLRGPPSTEFAGEGISPQAGRTSVWGWVAGLTSVRATCEADSICDISVTFAGGEPITTTPSGRPLTFGIDGTPPEIERLAPAPGSELQGIVEVRALVVDPRGAGMGRVYITATSEGLRADGRPLFRRSWPFFNLVGELPNVVREVVAHVDLRDYDAATAGPLSIVVSALDYFDNRSLLEEAFTVVQPAGAFCGDDTCDPDESCDTCPHDCGICPAPTCGDGTCDPDERCESCPADCGTCPEPVCGDGTCDPDEGCESCPADCGACPPDWTCGQAGVYPEDLTITAWDDLDCYAAMTGVAGRLSIALPAAGRPDGGLASLPALEAVDRDLHAIAEVGAEGPESLALPSLIAVDGAFRIIGLPHLHTLSVPALTAAGSVEITDTALASVDLPALAAAEEILVGRAYHSSPTVAPALAELHLPALTEVGSLTVRGAFNDRLPLALLDLSALVTVSGSGFVLENTHLPALELPSLESASAFVVRSNRSLGGLSLPVAAQLGVAPGPQQDLIHAVEIEFNTTLSIIELPALLSFGRDVYLQGMPLTSLYAPLLQSASEVLVISGAAPPLLELPSLTRAGYLGIDGNEGLQSLHLPSLVSLGNEGANDGGLSINSNAVLSPCHAHRLEAALRAEGWTGSAIIAENGHLMITTDPSLLACASDADCAQSCSATDCEQWTCESDRCVPSVTGGGTCDPEAADGCQGDDLAVCVAAATDGSVVCHLPIVTSCSGPDVCRDGACTCIPSCAPGDSPCGDDGCGGSCGSCDGEAWCEEGQCIDDATLCADVPTEGCCTGAGVRRHCEGGVFQEEACATCGWEADAGAYTCSDAERGDPSGSPWLCPGETCDEVCLPGECGYKCGVPCGDCGEGERCVSHTCVVRPVYESCLSAVDRCLLEGGCECVDGVDCPSDLAERSACRSACDADCRQACGESLPAATISAYTALAECFNACVTDGGSPINCQFGVCRPELDVCEFLGDRDCQEVLGCFDSCDAGDTACSTECYHSATLEGGLDRRALLSCRSDVCQAQAAAVARTLRFELSWSRSGDGDIIVRTPNGHQIQYNNMGPSAGTDFGRLLEDVGSGFGPEVVLWTEEQPPPAGIYHVCGLAWSSSFSPAASASAPVEFSLSVFQGQSEVATHVGHLATSADPVCEPGANHYIASFTQGDVDFDQTACRLPAELACLSVAGSCAEEASGAESCAEVSDCVIGCGALSASNDACVQACREGLSPVVADDFSALWACLLPACIDDGSCTDSAGNVLTGVLAESASELCGDSWSTCRCAPGERACGLACVDTDEDPEHCGGCGVVCTGPGLSCAGGECLCADGGQRCGDSCVDTDSDASHCGECDAACPLVGQQCLGGQCACPVGQEPCLGRCLFPGECAHPWEYPAPDDASVIIGLGLHPVDSGNAMGALIRYLEAQDFASGDSFDDDLQAFIEGGTVGWLLAFPDLADAGASGPITVDGLFGEAETDYATNAAGQGEFVVSSAALLPSLGSPAWRMPGSIDNGQLEVPGPFALWFDIAAASTRWGLTGLVGGSLTAPVTAGTGGGLMTTQGVIGGAFPAWRAFQAVERWLSRTAYGQCAGDAPDMGGVLFADPGTGELLCNTEWQDPISCGGIFQQVFDFCEAVREAVLPGLLQPDLDTDSDGEPDALSVQLDFSMVSARLFPPPEPPASLSIIVTTAAGQSIHTDPPFPEGGGWVSYGDNENGISGSSYREIEATFDPAPAPVFHSAVGPVRVELLIDIEQDPGSCWDWLVVRDLATTPPTVLRSESAQLCGRDRAVTLHLPSGHFSIGVASDGSVSAAAGYKGWRLLAIELDDSAPD